MALHPNFPESPHAILDPSIRWFPADETLRSTSADKLMPPLVPELRKKVKQFRDSGYEGATQTSKSLLNWWFKTPHLIQKSDSSSEFQYFFSQREALETIVYLVDVMKVKDKYDLIRFDSSGAVSANMFDETWKRFVVKMATGAGKTKVISLALAWSFFHKLYEETSPMARNFLVIAPNIIVLDRIYKDFKGLRIFLKDDPVLPYDGFDGREWKSDFQLDLHIQDDVRITNPIGNIFLTNIHRVYSGNDIPASAEDEDSMDYFLGTKPTGATNDSKVDLSKIVRDIEELMVINDEAHHVHDPQNAWFKSIQDIHNRLQQKGTALSLQLDVTATPKHANGAIFVQTISDYPLVEAIKQNVVKHPLVPDGPSRAKLTEKKSSKFTEKYSDYINLGVIEWRKAYEEHLKLDKKAILFIMTDDTKNCDDLADYLENTYADLKGAVLVIHTKNNGEISEASSGKNKEELDKLREQANTIDSNDSHYKAIISVMVLREGWDVRNVTTIVGLRAFTAQNNILPEQALGRGLRKMYPGNIQEFVSIVGTPAFMDFVESIQQEGVELERGPMGSGSQSRTPLVVEIDSENKKKDLEALDIEIPIMTPRIYREYKNLNNLDVSKFGHKPVGYQDFSDEEQREIVFKDITTGNITHTTVLDASGLIDFNSVAGYFTHSIMKDLRLVSGYAILYGKVKEFISSQLFGKEIELDTPNTVRNLSEVEATRTIIETFKKKINDLTVQDKGDAEIRDYIKLRNTRPFIAKEQGFIVPKKSVFNKVIGDSHLELEFSTFLEECEDVISYSKNYLAVHFKIDYVNADGDISNYYPDFFVKVANNEVYIVETKGLEDLDVPLKMFRLKQWCEDINRVQKKIKYDFVFVDQESFEKYEMKNFKQMVENFREFKD
ncbi:MAG: type III restriction endonuclease subunit R [Bdellovibrionales bacterium CG10_big_fil_rev_8_21_14_0_10_45_34]|nr:MAG: type III restriction endonuclease subunit R [Bdellovibrionales bacterium CG10_big_fil_rev_8_21_14_0_10_45_34]